MKSGHLPGIYTVPSSDYQKSGYKVVIFEESTQYLSPCPKVESAIKHSDRAV